MASTKKNSDESVYQKLKNAIRKRYIKQGSQLVEVTLAEQLGVSRTPVRSAIKRLETEGLVNSVPNRGAFVITPTFREIEETFLVRSELEQMATGLTAEKISDKQIKELNKIIQKEVTVFDKTDLEDYYRANDNLHLNIAKYSNNKVLYSHIKMLLDRTRIFLVLFDPFFKLEFSPSLVAHQEIVDALENHDPVKARLAMKTHIQSSVDGLETLDLVPEDYLTL